MIHRLMRRLVSCTALLALTAAAQAASTPLAITVYGGTGNIGQRIVQEALNRGHTVTVVARNPETLAVSGSGLAVARGDVTDAAQVGRQLAGQDVVISAIGIGRDAGQGDDLLPRAAQSLVTALRSLGPRAPRLIVVGGASTLQSAAGNATAATPPRAGSPQQQQQRALDYLRTVKDVSWSYFSPASQIQPGNRTGKFRLGVDQLVKDASGNSRISIEDYAVAMIDEAERPAHVRQQFTIGY